MRQYRDGARFVRGVVDRVGMDGFNAVWAAPANLPDQGRDRRPGAPGSRRVARPPAVRPDVAAGPTRRSPRSGAPSGAALADARPPATWCSSPAAAAPTRWRSPPRRPSRRRGAGLRGRRGDRRPRAAGRLGRAGRRRSPRGCAALGLDPVEVVARRPSARAGGPGGGRPRRAVRRARRRPPTRLGAAAVLLGHTLDDQAETVLLGLARGSGRPVAGRHAPPAPAATAGRCSTLAATDDRAPPARRWASSPWDDPHNADPRYARVRVRHEVLPVLEDALGPGRRRGAGPHRRPAARRRRRARRAGAAPRPRAAGATAAALAVAALRGAAGRASAPGCCALAALAAGCPAGDARRRARRRARRAWSPTGTGRGRSTCPGGVAAPPARVAGCCARRRRPAEPPTATDRSAARGRDRHGHRPREGPASPRSRSRPGSPSWPPRSTPTTRARTCCSSASSRAR